MAQNAGSGTTWPIKVRHGDYSAQCHRTLSGRPDFAAATQAMALLLQL